MSRSHSAPRWGMGAFLAGFLALTLIALLAVAPAPRADAAFSTGKCAGDNIIGRGASFARDAHEVFNEYFKQEYCQGTLGFEKIDVTYEAQGSGAGRTSVKIRNGDPRFGMTDEPPVPKEIEEMNKGIAGTPAAIDSDPTNDGLIHVVPAAVGAVAPLVNFPDGCPVMELDEESRTVAGASDPEDLARVRFSKDEFEKIWAKEETHDTWNEVFSELTDPDCAVPIIRVVRFDESGTSFAFKDNLDTIDESRGWLEEFGSQGTGGTRRWPGFVGADGGYGPRTDCPKVGEPPQFPNGPGKDSVLPGGNEPGEGEAGPGQLTSACFNGNQGIVSKMVETDGSVGYSDISTARRNPQSYAIEPGTGDNDIYWTQIPSGPGAGAFEEPTADPDGFRSDGELGSNCQGATFVNQAGGGLPTTLEDWSQVSGVNSAGAYAVCTMTYALVFDDNSDVWGGCPSEESKAKTVKDYWESNLTDEAQEDLFSRDYSPLPNDVLALAKAGIAQVDWEKGGAGACASGGGGGGDGGGGGGTTPPAGDSSTPPPPPPSNLFSLTRTTISSKTGQAKIAVKLPGAGQLVLIGKARVQVPGKAKKKRKNRRNRKRTKTINVGRVVLNANKAGTYNLTLKPNGAAKKALRKKGRLQVTLTSTFTPVGGSAKTSTSKVTLKLNKPKKKKRAKRR